MGNRRGSTRWLRVQHWSVETRIAVAMIGVQLLVRAFFVRNSYYFQDDFGHLALARELGLTSDYLVRDYGGHLEVGQYFLIWVLSHFMDDSFGFAAASIVAMQGVVSVLLWIVLRQLFGRSLALLVPLAVYLFTPLALTWSSWWAAALQTLPLQFFMLIAIWGMVRFVRDGRRSGAWVSILAQVAGLVFWEKAAFILPTLLAVQVLVLADGSLRERLRSLLRRPWFFGGQLVVLVGYVAVYFALVESVVQRDEIDAPKLVGNAIFRMTIPGLFGGPWHAENVQWTVYPHAGTSMAVVAALALAALCWYSFRVTDRRALAGWILIAGYLTADVMILALGRSDYLAFLATDPRYVADALPVIAIGLAAAFRGVLEDPPSQSPSAAALAARATPEAVCGVVAVLFVSGLVTQLELAPETNHEYPRNYSRGFMEGLEDNPGASVINGTVPYEISARTDVAQFAMAIGVEFEFDRPGASMYLIDAFGSLQPARIIDGEVTAGPDPECGWQLSSRAQDVTTVDVERRGTTLLRVAYEATEETELVVTTGEVTQRYTTGAGAGEVYFVLPRYTGEVEVARDGGGDACVSEVEVGYAWVE